jgi:polyvinyl alcohol dehydrogenase (cytochrome)
VYWSVKTQAAVRSAVSVGRASNGMLMAYFGDFSATVYGVDASTGKVLWKTKLDEHPLAKISSSATLHEGRLYVGVASGEENEAAKPTYECCTFRGSVVALDGATGRQIWKTYMVPDAPVRTGTNPRGTQRWGSSGAAIWSSPTVDPRLRAIYVATGNNYSPPATPTSDAVVALEIDSGKIRWTRQLVKDDTWNTACPPRAADHANCPDLEDPDFDFGSSPMLVELAGGRRMLVAGQKSGLVYGIEPERGMVLWEQRVGRGGTQGGVLWGPAADTGAAYVAVSDATRVGATNDFDPKLGGGLVAIDLITGQKRWSAPALPCREMDKSCSPAQAAAVSVIPGVVFSGSADGHLRAYSTRDGKILWDYDTVREYATVNGIKGKGGTINNGGPAIAGGMVFTNSGYNHITGMYPGNVLLAFGVE